MSTTFPPLHNFKKSWLTASGQDARVIGTSEGESAAQTHACGSNAAGAVGMLGQEVNGTFGIVIVILEQLGLLVCVALVGAFGVVRIGLRLLRSHFVEHGGTHHDVA